MPLSRFERANRTFHYRLACTYIIGAAFWNFVGAGVFGGGTLNAPLAKHGTFLTLNHDAHTSLFGAFGLLAVGLVYFCLRYAAGERVAFNERLGLWAFWLYNAGLVLWVPLNFFPIGWAASTGWPMRAASNSTTKRCSGSGCAFQAIMCLPWPLCTSGFASRKRTEIRSG
jgi:nitric oxide reductase large subunit